MILLYLFNFYCVSSIEVFHFADIKKEFVRVRSIPRYFFYSCISSCFSQVHKLWRSKKIPQKVVREPGKDDGNPLDAGST